MRGSIIKRSKDSYTIIINLGLDPSTGQRRQQWVSVKGNKKDAEKKLAEMLHQLDTGALFKPGKVTVSEYLRRWLTEYCRPNLSPRSFERYQGIVRKHLIPAFGNILLTQLRPEHIQKHYAALYAQGLAARTVRYDHVVIHRALKLACKWALLSRNVADTVDPPRAHDKEMNTWDEDNIIRFLNTAKDTTYYALFHTALFTGMRRSELLALRWCDVDFIFSQISVSRSLHQINDGSYVFTQPKSAKSQRSIALSPSAILVLKEYHEKQKLERMMRGISLTDEDLVFSHPDGKPFRPNTVSRAWNILATRAGVNPIRFHDARHTHASLMLKQGTHPKIVQERLGHSTISVTLDTYSHVAPGLQEAAANRFDEAFTNKYNETANETVG